MDTVNAGVAALIDIKSACRPAFRPLIEINAGNGRQS
jgi:hypothetical protein